jgi:hypothetical protein
MEDKILKKLKYRKTTEHNKETDTISHFYDIEPDFTLFQYRQCSSYNLSSLVDDSLWGSTPDRFNDPYDSVFRFDFPAAIKYAQSIISEEDIQSLNDSKRKKSSKTIIKEFFDDQYVSSVTTMKRSVLITCLSEVGDSEIMWSHYADNGKGFVVEYNFDDLQFMINKEIEVRKQMSIEQSRLFNLLDLEQDNWNKFYGIKPVLYINSKYKANELLNKTIDLLKENLDRIKNNEEPIIDFNSIIKRFYDPVLQEKISTNVYYIKKRNWIYEKEWRIVMPNMVLNQAYLDNSHDMVGYVRPKAIYLGEYIMKGHEFLIKEFAKKNNIPLYKMSSGNYRNTRILKPIPIKNEK